MFFIKVIILICIFGTCSFIGINYSKKYINRVNNLKEIKTALDMFKTKIEYTYEPLSEIFTEISKNINWNIAKIFTNASKKMKTIQAGQAWSESIDEANIELTKEDRNVIKGLSKLLGKTSIKGQLSEIELTIKFLDKQIEIAEYEKRKNQKLYRTLGITVGLAIVIILL